MLFRDQLTCFEMFEAVHLGLSALRAPTVGPYRRRQYTTTFAACIAIRPCSRGVHSWLRVQLLARLNVLPVTLVTGKAPAQICIGKEAKANWSKIVLIGMMRSSHGMEKKPIGTMPNQRVMVVWSAISHRSFGNRQQE